MFSLSSSGTEEGKIHKCSKTYSSQFLETYDVRIIVLGPIAKLENNLAKIFPLIVSFVAKPGNMSWTQIWKHPSFDLQQFPASERQNVLPKQLFHGVELESTSFHYNVSWFSQALLKSSSQFVFSFSRYKPWADTTS